MEFPRLEKSGFLNANAFVLLVLTSVKHLFLTFSYNALTTVRMSYILFLTIVLQKSYNARNV
jgi:hypothetical protein